MPRRDGARKDGDPSVRRASEPGRGLGPVALFAIAAGAGFAIGLTVLFVLRSGGGPGQPPAGPVGLDGPPPAVRPVFTDIAEASGILFRHEAGITGRFYYPEVMGAGCAFFDADGDGRLDIYLVNGNKLPPDSPDPAITNVLYRNEGNGKFSDVTKASGTGDPAYGQGCCAADFDGDGDQDVYVTNFGPNVLFRNAGSGVFERMEGIAADPGWGQSCAFFDFDGDGDLDLYDQNYLEYSIEKQEPWYTTIGGKRELDYCSPSGYQGQQDRLYENRGDGTFRDVTADSGIVAAEGTGMGLACADLDGDGDQDVVVSNDSRPNFYYRNEGGRFVQDGLVSGFGYNAEGGVEAFMGIDVGDYDGDGLLDLVVPSLRSQGANLYRNLGGTFREVSAIAGVDAATAGSTGFAPVFLDHDLDGDLDLFFTCGEVRMGRAEGGAEGTFEQRYAMRCLLLENRGGRYVDVSRWAGPSFAERRIWRACSAGDIDDDGDTDLLVTAMGGRPALLRNDTAGGNWVGVALEGRASNRDAVGARLWLSAGGRTLFREIHAGGSYLGQRDRRVVFGLGPARAYDTLRVRWPDGAETSHAGLEIGRYHRLRQAEAAPPR